VPRAAVSIRAAVPGDLPAMIQLWGQLRDQAPRRGARPLATNAPGSVEERYRAAIADEGCRLVVATLDDAIVGMALLTVTSASTLLDLPAVQVSHLSVADRHRRRGVGKALVAAAANYADERGVDQVMVAVYPQHRDANRFFARLGFAPVVVRRVAPLPVLRRQLATEDGRPATLRRELRLRRGRPGRAAHLGHPIAPVPQQEQ